MRGWLVLVVLAIVCIAPPRAALAQRGEDARTLQALARTPITRFRPRSDADRLDALSLLQIHINSEALGPSFVLTPRTPFVANRGALSTARTHFNASFDTTGFHAAIEDGSGLTFHLFGLNANRVLADCAMSGVNGQAFSIIVKSPGQPDDSQSIIAQNGRIYFATHPLSGGADILFNFYHDPSDGQWIFTGCEFTLLPAQ
jgi:hypothetical protein